MIGIIICHKHLAMELITTAKAIVGHHHDLYPFSNDNVTAENLLTEIENFLLSKGNPEKAIIMVDLRGGNCWRVAKMLTMSHPKYVVLSGVNLPMLFSFLTKKDRLNDTQLYNNMETDSHRGIIIEK